MTMSGIATIQLDVASLESARSLERTVEARALSLGDTESLRALEITKWGAEGATSSLLQQRIKNTPGFCWGGFSPSNEALASCFVMGTSEEKLMNSKNWYEASDHGTAETHDPNSRYLFGISLSGTDSVAVRKVLTEVLMRMLLSGIKEVYLGAPMPGFKNWKKSHPSETPRTYAKKWVKKNGRKRHVDPLLNYYTHLGFEIVRTLPNYFPHEMSEDHATILRFRNELWFLSFVFRMVPQKLLKKLVWAYASKL